MKHLLLNWKGSKELGFILKHLYLRGSIYLWQRHYAFLLWFQNFNPLSSQGRPKSSNYYLTDAEPVTWIKPTREVMTSHNLKHRPARMPARNIIFPVELNFNFEQKYII